MKKFNPNLILVAFALVLSFHLHSQSAIDNFTFKVETIPNNLGIPDLDTLYTIKCIIQISQPDSVSTIYLNVGTSKNSNDIINQSFSTSRSWELPDGMSLLKHGNKFYVMPGDYFDYKYYYEIKLEDLSGNVSEPVLLTL